jgi:hypothetical protein
MNRLSFVWAESSPLAGELSKPIRRVSEQFENANFGPTTATLWRPDGAGLSLYSQMHDVAEKIEVGVLNFERASAPGPNETIVDVAPAFQGEIAVSKLVIFESGTSAESGVVLRASNGEEIVIVAGAFPCTIAVFGVGPMPHIFEPEYELDRYTRVPLT